VEKASDHHGKNFVEALLTALGDAAGLDLDDDVALLVLECAASAFAATREGEAPTATTAPRSLERFLS
jgi:hypothetical protein